MKPTILIAGATGNLGHLIARYVIQNGHANVSAIVRNLKAPKTVVLKHEGVQLIEADYKDVKSLVRATKGIKTVISALSGGPDIIVKGQMNLLEAAVENGVDRFVPSDYSVDYFNLDYNDNVNLDMRKIFFEAVTKSNIAHTVFLTGAFTEIFAAPFFNVIDFEKRTVNFWGEGTELFDLTTIPDTAKYIASAVFDKSTMNKIVRIAGDETNMNTITDLLAQQTGKSFAKIINGSKKDLTDLIDSLKSADPGNVMAYVFHQYKLPMFNGVGKLTSPVRKHYDGSSFMSFKEFIANPKSQYSYQVSL